MSAGYPGSFPGGYTTGYRNIGAVQKTKTGAAGFPGVFPGGYTTGYETIGAVQRDSASISSIIGVSASRSGSAGTLAGAGALLGVAAGRSSETGTLTGAGALLGASFSITGATGTLAGAGAMTGAAASRSGATALSSTTSSGVSIAFSWAAAGQGEVASITGVAACFSWLVLSPNAFTHLQPRSAVMSFMQDALEDLENDVGNPKIHYNGHIYPCVLSSIRRGNVLELGGFMETIVLTAFIRQNAMSCPITVDSTLETVDSEMFSSDNDRGGSSTLVATPHAGKRAAHRGRQYRVLAVADVPGSSHWELSLGTVNN